MRRLAILQALMIICFGVSLSGAQDQMAGSLTVYAATSLTDVFETARDAFVEVHPDVEMLLNFANSSTLAAQIRAGAPADVFASANELQMNKAVESGRVDDAEVEIFAHNRLMVIVPAANPANIQALDDIAEDGVLLVLAAKDTPIRAYTDAMLVSASSDHGADFSERVLRNLVSEESNVRQVVARVALGEADAGVVYQSDALGDVAERLITVSIDERHNQLAAYPIAPLNDAARQDLAEAFIRFLRSEVALPILEQNGFCWPPMLVDVNSSVAVPEPTPEAADERKTPEIDCEAATIES